MSWRWTCWPKTSSTVIRLTVRCTIVDDTVSLWRCFPVTGTIDDDTVSLWKCFTVNGTIVHGIVSL